jgi:hypothetical protein
MSVSPFSPPASNRSLGAKEAAWRQDRHARELAENEEIAVAGDDSNGVCGDR